MKKKTTARRPKLKPVKVKKTIEIGEREIAILKDLAGYRYLTTDQILKLHFLKGSRSYCNKRLRFLYHKPHHLVERHALPLESGKGSSKITYSISSRGLFLLQQKGFDTSSLIPNITPEKTYQKIYKMKRHKAEYKSHEIAINDVRIAVELAVKSKGWQIEEWISDVVFKHPFLRSVMRVYDSVNRDLIPVVPDGFFSIKISDGRKAVFFLELDRGNEDLDEFRRGKVRGYFLFVNHWLELPVFHKYKNLEIVYRLLTVVDGGVKRTLNLNNCAEAEFKGQERKEEKGRLYYFTEFSQISPETVLCEPIWMVPFKSGKVEERFPLFLTKPEKSP